MQTRAMRFHMPRVPAVFYYVTGRKCWDRKVPPKIRASWRVGQYGGLKVHH